MSVDRSAFRQTVNSSIEEESQYDDSDDTSNDTNEQGQTEAARQEAQEKDQWLKSISSIWGMNVDFLDYPPIQFQHENPSWKRIANENIFHSFMPKNKVILQHFIKRFDSEKKPSQDASLSPQPRRQGNLQVPTIKFGSVEPPKSSVGYIGKQIHQALKSLDNKKPQVVELKDKKEVKLKAYQIQAAINLAKRDHKLTMLAELEKKHDFVNHNNYSLNNSLQINHEIGSMFEIQQVRQKKRRTTKKMSNKFNFHIPKHSNTHQQLQHGSGGPGGDNTPGLKNGQSKNSLKMNFFAKRNNSSIPSPLLKRHPSIDKNEKSQFGRENSGLSQENIDDQPLIPSFSHLTNLNKEVKLPSFVTSTAGKQLAALGITRNSKTGQRKSLQVNISHQSAGLSNNYPSMNGLKSDTSVATVENSRRKGWLGQTRRKSDCSMLSGGISQYEKKTLDVVVDIVRSTGMHQKSSQFFFGQKNGDGACSINGGLNINIHRASKRDQDENSLDVQDCSITKNQDNSNHGIEEHIKKQINGERKSNTSSTNSLNESGNPSSPPRTSIPKNQHLNKINEVDSLNNTPRYISEQQINGSGKKLSPTKFKLSQTLQQDQRVITPQQLSKTQSNGSIIQHQVKKFLTPKLTPSSHRLSSTTKNSSQPSSVLYLDSGRTKSQSIHHQQPIDLGTIEPPKKKKKRAKLPQLKTTKAEIPHVYSNQSTPLNKAGSYNKLNELLSPTIGQNSTGGLESYSPLPKRSGSLASVYPPASLLSSPKSGTQLLLAKPVTSPKTTTNLLLSNKKSKSPRKVASLKNSSLNAIQPKKVSTLTTPASHLPKIEPSSTKNLKSNTNHIKRPKKLKA